MSTLPSIKTHPVLMSIVTITFLFAFGAVCAGGGWWLRAMSESRAELSVVVDDGKFMQALEVQTQEWVEEFNQWDSEFHNENKIPDCMAQPMPSFYHDDDSYMRGIKDNDE